MIRPSRSRHGPVRRGLALWLIAAQWMLFVAAGLTHKHVMPACSASVARASGNESGEPAHSTRVAAPTTQHHGAPPDCAICQAACATIASLTATPHVPLHTLLGGRAPILRTLSLPALLTGPSSTRAPPAA
jgi:hypothetical protein